MLNPNDVFDVYPEVNEIFEVNGQPFLTRNQAAGHAKTLLEKDKREIITHKRPAPKAKKEKTTETNKAVGVDLAEAKVTEKVPVPVAKTVDEES